MRVDIHVHLDGPITINVSPSDEVPAWAEDLVDGIAEVITRLGHVEHKEDQMKQSTQDLTDAVTELTGTVTDVGTAIDALVAAQDSGDDAAVEAQVAILKGLGPQLKAHLPVVASAGTAAVQAEPDSGATIAAS